ncbi:MAG: hypothetical protein IKP02_00135 [Paludibacteraceae bacterium]|nr:hypothetical protein [Paludibacteraceae bacterium]
MKGTKSKEDEQWLKARRQAAQMGVVLTRRKKSEGGYVCYMTQKAKKNWF